MLQRPRCEVRTRRGTLCQSPATDNIVELPKIASLPPGGAVREQSKVHRNKVLCLFSRLFCWVAL